MTEEHPAPGSADEPAGLRAHSLKELTRRAQAGIVMVASRGALILLVSLGGQLVLARLLRPADFGAVAFGLTVVAFVSLFCDGGLGAGLIRRREPPEREELQALTALQVSVATALTLAVALAAPLVGRAGWITALIVLSAPLLTLQIPGRILLERDLRFDRVARAEVLQVLVFNVWAVTTVLAGAGVWGLASAPVVRAAVGVVLFTRASPMGTPFPRFSWTRIRGLVRFGVRFQTVTALWLVREQGLNVGVAAVAGTTTLGLVSLGRRILEIPYLLLVALWRVSFPAMSQLVARNQPVTALLEKVVGTCATGLGLVLVGLAAGAHGVVPGLFGDSWTQTAELIPPACLGLGIAGPISVACQGYLFAVEDSAAVLRAGTFQTLTLFATILPLLPVLGVLAVGVGWLVSFLVEAVVLGRAASRHTGARLGRSLLAPTVCGGVAGALGWLVTSMTGATLLGGVAGAATAVTLMASLLLVLDRSTFVGTFRVARSFLRAARDSGAHAGTSSSGTVIP